MNVSDLVFAELIEFKDLFFFSPNVLEFIHFIA
jgi:hypothetical protein